MSVYLSIKMRLRDKKKYNAIVKASIRLVNKLGFSGISIAKIAKEAKVSPATIYIYFENKEDLFTKIYIDIRKKMGQAAMNELDDNKSIEEQFKSIWHNYLTYALAHIDFFIYRENFEQTSMMKKIQHNDFELFNCITDIIQRGVKEQCIKNLSLTLLTSFAFMPIITMLKFHFEGRINIDDKLINQASNLAWNAVKI
ncbi:MAG: hypothetical protein B6I17_04655 [Tenericutes bacterium 4572_104]|nr:MAG: hypothetical protein B6I17_04655 [Tenericutes bacterium 4572_104]